MREPVTCRCGCGGTFIPSKATHFRIKRGDPVGYLPGHHAKGERNNKWIGGRPMLSHGYRMVLMPEHANAMKNGYVLEHRLVASQMIGRPIADDEEVHHKNGNRSDNRPENLEVLKETTHKQQHAKRRRAKRCQHCGQMFIKQTGNHYRDKRCSLACRSAAMIGEDASNVKLTDADVAAIRALAGTPHRTIAARFNVSKTQVGRILRGECR